MYGNQILGAEFYKKEPSKPLFKKHDLLTVHSLHKYHCLLEMFKIIKLHTPMPLYELFNRSKKGNDKLISLNPSILFDYQSSNLWIKSRKSDIDYTTSITCVKQRLTQSLLDFQSKYGEDWHKFNFENDHFQF